MTEFNMYLGFVRREQKNITQFREFLSGQNFVVSPLDDANFPLNTPSFQLKNRESAALFYWSNGKREWQPEPARAVRNRIHTAIFTFFCDGGLGLGICLHVEGSWKAEVQKAEAFFEDWALFMNASDGYIAGVWAPDRCWADFQESLDMSRFMLHLENGQLRRDSLRQS